METIEIPELCGPQHIKIPQELSASYEQLYSAIRENYPQTRFSRFFPLQGENYDESVQLSRLAPFDNLDVEDKEQVKKYLEPATKLMVIGRSVNGWTEMTESDSKSFSASATHQLTSFEGFSWLKNDGQGKTTYTRESDGKECRYNVNKSAFLRSTRKILKELKPVSHYQERWFENIVWNNLYPVAPLHSGNAVGNLQDVQLEACKKLLIEQIKF